MSIYLQQEPRTSSAHFESPFSYQTVSRPGGPGEFPAHFHTSVLGPVLGPVNSPFSRQFPAFLPFKKLPRNFRLPIIFSAFLCIAPFLGLFEYLFLLLFSPFSTFSRLNQQPFLSVGTPSVSPLRCRIMYAGIVKRG